MDRRQAIDHLLAKVSKALTRTSRRLEHRSSSSAVFIQTLNLTADLSVDGIIAAPLLTPAVEMSIEDRRETARSFISHLGESRVTKEIRKEVGKKLGVVALSFIFHGKTTEDRYARFLWLLGQSKGLELEVGDNTLLIDDGTERYGVKDGVMVGCGYDGLPITLRVNELLSSKKRTSRSRRVIAAHYMLKSRADVATYDAFRILYSISEWDKSVPFESALIPRLRGFSERVDRLSVEVMESDEPYWTLYRGLVPYCMTYADFRALIGNPHRKAKNLKVTSRARLINKLYQLPFLK